MSSMLTSQGMVLATAMAVSGTMILLAAFRLQKSPEFSSSFNPILHHQPPIRSCISSDGKKEKKKKRRVHFAEDVVEPSGNSEQYRKMHCNSNFRQETTPSSSSSSSHSNALKKSGKVVKEMPANRAALYNSMLKGRVIHRVTYSY